MQRFDNDFTIPKNFVKTAPAYDKNSPKKKSHNPTAIQNPQTVQFCEKLAIDDPLQLISDNSGIPLSLSMEESFNNTTFIDDTLEGDQLSVSMSSPSKKLGSLSLPEPKMDSSIIVIETSQDIEDIKDNKESILDEDVAEKEMDNEKDEEVKSNIDMEVEPELVTKTEQIDDCTEPLKVTEVKPNEKPDNLPMPKKLKRRNENLYKN